MGVMGGIGIGLIIGGIVGYISKGSAIREEEKRKQICPITETKQRIGKESGEHQIIMVLLMFKRIKKSLGIFPKLFLFNDKNLNLKLIPNPPELRS